MSLCAFTAGCGAARANSGDMAVRSNAASAGDAAAEEPIDDEDLVTQMEQGAVLLHEGGRTTPMKTLVAQLQRTGTKTRLAKLPTAALSNSELYQRAKASVLVLGNLYNCGKCDKTHVGMATAFVISADGLAVTNYHVVDRPDNMTLVAMNSDGQVFAVKEIVAASKADDLAIVRLDATGLPALPIAPRIAPGERVRVISHPDGFLYSLTAGIVSRTFMGERTGEKVPVLQITADFAKGSSGAPVLDDRGAVVGVVSYTKSVFHDNGADKKRNLQMVFKNCAPSARLLALLGR